MLDHDNDKLYQKYRDMSLKELEWYLYNTKGNELNIVKELIELRNKENKI